MRSPDICFSVRDWTANETPVPTVRSRKIQVSWVAQLKRTKKMDDEQPIRFLR